MSLYNILNDLLGIIVFIDSFDLKLARRHLHNFWLFFFWLLSVKFIIIIGFNINVITFSLLILSLWESLIDIFRLWYHKELLDFYWVVALIGLEWHVVHQYLRNQLVSALIFTLLLF